jgi:hypothetical protein
MSFEKLLGRSVRLPIDRIASPGAFFKTEAGDLLLPGRELPAGAKPGDEIEIFVYLDSEDRPIGTVHFPKVEMGEVAFLEVTESSRIGAFVDWGLAKQLLVPFAEQTAPVVVGNRYAIGLYLDKTGRLAGTMRVSELLDLEQVEWKLDEWVDGEAWRNDPDIGLFVILERAFVGLVPRAEPHKLSRGEAAKFRIANILPDGKLELSLRGLAHEEVEGDVAKIKALLDRASPPQIGDKSSPETIRDLLGLSKKAFKRAVGRMLKEGTVMIDDSGYVKRAR